MSGWDDEHRARKALNAEIGKELHDLCLNIAKMPPLNDSLITRYGDRVYETYDDYGVEWQLFRNMATNRLGEHYDHFSREYREWASANTSRDQFIAQEIDAVVREKRDEIIKETNVKPSTFNSNFDLMVTRKHDENKRDLLERIQKELQQHIRIHLRKIFAGETPWADEALLNAYQHDLDYSRERLGKYHAMYYSDGRFRPDSSHDPRQQEEGFANEQLAAGESAALASVIGALEGGKTRKQAHDVFARFKQALEARIADAGNQLSTRILGGTSTDGTVSKKTGRSPDND